MATVTPGYTFTSNEVVTPAKLNLAATPAISNIVTTDIVNANITSEKLAGSLDLSAKTLTFPNNSITNAIFNGSVGLNPWQTRTANYTAIPGDRINANTSGGAFTITLPASPAAYAEITLADHAGTWETNNLTVARNGQNINGGTLNLTCDVAGKQILLRYEGATIGWRIYT
jgi:hypothetical protein